MSFNHKILSLGETEHYVWQRDSGNLVVVVIDDQCGLAMADPERVTILDETILPLLREHVCNWEATKAIGFFRLMATPTNAEQVLTLIQDWLDEITDCSSQTRFLVDALYGGGVQEGTRHTILQLTEQEDSRDHIAYLTKGTTAALAGLPGGYRIFLKGDEAGWVQRHDELSPELLAFLG